MANTQMVIAQAYSAFNRRDVDGALALMSETSAGPRRRKAVVWLEKKKFVPIGRVSGIDPHVEPIEVIDREGARLMSGFISS